MTLEEAKIRAEYGDTNAMMALAKHYFKDADNDKSYELACMYQERAAEAGDPNALTQLAQSSQLVAKAALQFLEQCGNSETITHDLENALKWTSKLLHNIQNNNIHGEAEQFAFEVYLDSIYWLSAVYCLEENYVGILHITKGISSPIAQALHGLALFQLSKTNAEMNQSFAYLKNILDPIVWSDKFGTTQTLELLRVETGLALSQMHLNYKDADSAYNTLSTMLQNTKDFELRNTIQKNMSRYRKTLFGGYKYIG